MPTPFALLAQVSVLFSDEDFIEVFIWGVVFLFAIVLLFIINRVLRDQLGRYVRSQRTPFAVSPEDLERMKKAGQLTEEELKAIRQTVARKVVERAEQEAATALQSGARSGNTIEDSIRRKAALHLAEQNPPAPPPTAKDDEPPPDRKSVV